MPRPYMIDNIVLLLLSSILWYYASGNEAQVCIDGICDLPQSNEVMKLRPCDLPAPVLFSNWSGSENSTVILPYNNGTLQVVARGVILQPGFDRDHFSSFDVLPEVVPRSTIAQVLNLLRGSTPGSTSLPLDVDPDTVDGMATQEIFLDNDSLRKGEASKGHQEDMVQRKKLRQRVRHLLDPFLDEKITPYVRQRYAKQCGEDRKGRSCTPCYSLIRRYRAGERISHAPHHDGHAYITVVVSLSDYGTEYRGGLYVASEFHQRDFLALSRGDAVVHQGDLFHGVKILENTTLDADKITGEVLTSTERWSWILWYRDSNSCDDHSNSWYQSCALEGNPTCQLLHARNMQSAEEVLYWNQQASENGHGAASVKLARAHLKLLPSSLPFDFKKAKSLFQRAIDLTNEPDGHYGLAHIYLAELNGKSAQDSNDLMFKALSHLESSAKGGHPFAMFNLGVAHLYGYGYIYGEHDPNLAGAWFEASGLPEGFFVKAMHLNSSGKKNEAEEFMKRAAILGYGSPWRKPAREHTGSGGAGGVNLNLPWPVSAFGNKPDEF